jgi:hypothetical protein
MKGKILALLEGKFQGVRKDGLNHLAGAMALQVATEDEASAAVERLTAEQVNQFVADWRREADAEITKANRTHEDGLKKKYDLVEKKSEKPEGGNPPGAVDVDAIVEIVKTAVRSEYKERLDALEGSAVGATRRKLIEKELAGVPEGYRGKVLKDFDRMTFKDEDSFNEYLGDTKKDVATMVQELADKGLSGMNKPLFGAVDTEGVSAGVQGYIKERTESENRLTGKDV